MSVFTSAGGAEGSARTTIRNIHRSTASTINHGPLSRHPEPLSVGQSNHDGDCDVATEERRNFHSGTRRTFVEQEATVA